MLHDEKGIKEHFPSFFFLVMFKHILFSGYAAVENMQTIPLNDTDAKERMERQNSEYKPPISFDSYRSVLQKEGGQEEYPFFKTSTGSFFFKPHRGTADEKDEARVARVWKFTFGIHTFLVMKQSISQASERVDVVAAW